MGDGSMRWFKRVLMAVTVVALVLVLASALVYRQLKGTPDWYGARAMTEAERDAAASRAEHKLTEMQNWAAENRAREAARLQAEVAAIGPAIATTRPSATAPVTSAAAREATTIEFTEDEINAFFQKWVASSGWSEKFDEHVTDPAIVLRDGRVILAGQIKEVGALASVHFEPRIDDEGRLDLKLVRVLGGKLPLPKAVWTSQKERLMRSAAKHLPTWRRQASIDPKGTANLNAVSAGMTQILLNILAERPSDPVIFLPIAGRGAVPAELTAVSVADQTISLTVRPMSPAQREAFLRRLRTSTTPPVQTPADQSHSTALAR